MKNPPWEIDRAIYPFDQVGVFYALTKSGDKYPAAIKVRHIDVSIEEAERVAWGVLRRLITEIIEHYRGDERRIFIREMPDARAYPRFADERYIGLGSFRLMLIDDEPPEILSFGQARRKDV